MVSTYVPNSKSLHIKLSKAKSKLQKKIWSIQNKNNYLNHLVKLILGF